MKTKFLAFLLVLALAAPMLTACHDDDDNEVEPPVVGTINQSDLVGKWTCYSFISNEQEMNRTGYYITFNEDGTYKSHIGCAAYFYDGGTYTIEGSRINLVSNNGKYKITLSVTISYQRMDCNGTVISTNDWASFSALFMKTRI